MKSPIFLSAATLFFLLGAGTNYASADKADDAVHRIEKLEQELINERLRKEIDDLRRQTSAYARVQGYFMDPVRSAIDGFAMKPIQPTVRVVTPNPTTTAGQSVFPFMPRDKVQKAGT